MNKAVSTRFDQGREQSCVISLIPGDLARPRNDNCGLLAVDDLLDMVAKARNDMH